MKNTLNYRKLVTDENGDQYYALDCPAGHWLRWYSKVGDPQCLCHDCAAEATVGEVEIEALPVDPDGEAVFCQSCMTPLA